MESAIAALTALCGFLIVILLMLKSRLDRLSDQLEEERFRSRSLSTTYGQINEQWFPLMDRFPYDSQSFRFIGNPVDGIQFEEDCIVFCEFKTNLSGLSPVQRRIRDLVQAKRVHWEEFNFMADD